MKELSDEEKELKSKRKLVQEKLIKFSTRIPAFMYLTDFRENTLQDVITKIEPDLFQTVTGLTVTRNVCSRAGPVTTSRAVPGWRKRKVASITSSRAGWRIAMM
jgi:hypothetical protein